MGASRSAGLRPSIRPQDEASTLEAPVAPATAHAVSAGLPFIGGDAAQLRERVLALPDGTRRRRDPRHPASVRPQNAIANNLNKTHAASQLILSRTLHAVAHTPPRGKEAKRLDADPNRGNHRLDPNNTSSVTLIARPLNVKLLKNRHLSHATNTDWVATRMVKERLSDPATYYSFLTQSVIASCHSWVSTAGSLRLDFSAPRKCENEANTDHKKVETPIGPGFIGVFVIRNHQKTSENGWQHQKRLAVRLAENVT